MKLYIDIYQKKHKKPLIPEAYYYEYIKDTWMPVKELRKIDIDYEINSFLKSNRVNLFSELLNYEKIQNKARFLLKLKSMI